VLEVPAARNEDRRDTQIVVLRLHQLLDAIGKRRLEVAKEGDPNL
jgi:hypothetical protein